MPQSDILVSVWLLRKEESARDIDVSQYLIELYGSLYSFILLWGKLLVPTYCFLRYFEKRNFLRFAWEGEIVLFLWNYTPELPWSYFPLSHQGKSIAVASSK